MSTSKQPFDEASLDKARMTLNGMIETAQAEYDLKDMECRAFDERNRGEFDQTVADLSRIGSGIADDNAGILSAKKDINNALEQIAMQEKALKAAMGECEKTRMMNDMQLTTLKNDLAVAEFIVRMTECKEGAALLQDANYSAPVLQGCPMEDGSVHLSFKDGFLDNKAGMMLSKQGQQALRVALLKSHPSLDAPTKQQLHAVVKAAHREISNLVFSYRVSKQAPEKNAPAKKGIVEEEKAPTLSDIMNPPMEPKKEPTLEEATNKCVLGKPDCGLLTDNMALMWGEVKDAVDELTAIMAENEANCKATSDMHNGEISMWQGINSQKNVELSDATGALNAHTEEQTESQASKDLLT